jgi:DNA-binding protein H-NS
VQFEGLSVEQIQEQLYQVEQNRADLEKALEQRKQQEKYDVAQEVKDLIAQRGYALGEIVPLLSTRKRRAAAVAVAAKKSGRQYTRYVDPDNADNVYVRGVLPGWMKQKMVDNGYDPGVREDREKFKAEHLRAEED